MHQGDGFIIHQKSELLTVISTITILSGEPFYILSYIYSKNLLDDSEITYRLRSTDTLRKPGVICVLDDNRNAESNKLKVIFAMDDAFYDEYLSKTYSLNVGY